MLFHYLLDGHSIPSAILVFSIVIVLGLLIGKIKLSGISFGIAGVMFAGVILGYFGVGLKIEPHVLDFVREFGLILFVYTIGIQIGPTFISSFRRDGLNMNLLAALIVALGFMTTIAIMGITGLRSVDAVGVMSGAVTNTPGLGAAQQAIRDLYPKQPGFWSQPGLGYAMAYPFGIVGIILNIIIFKFWTRRANPGEMHFHREDKSHDSAASKIMSIPDVLPIFIGIVLGLLVGMVPVPIPGLPAPLRLGIAGGPLVVALFFGWVRKIGPLNWELPRSSNLLIREIGITLFLACVGLKCGPKFVDTIVNGDGLWWMLYGSIITFLPLFITGLIAARFIKLHYPAVCGLLAGSMTDPPALSFALQSCESDAPAHSYASVYALTMCLRILSAQLIVLIFSNC